MLAGSTCMRVHASGLTGCCYCSALRVGVACVNVAGRIADRVIQRPHSTVHFKTAQRRECHSRPRLAGE
jgi:hypothetical protein